MNLLKRIATLQCSALNSKTIFYNFLLNYIVISLTFYKKNVNIDLIKRQTSSATPKVCSLLRGRKKIDFFCVRSGPFCVPEESITAFSVAFGFLTYRYMRSLRTSLKFRAARLSLSRAVLP